MLRQLSVGNTGNSFYIFEVQCACGGNALAVVELVGLPTLFYLLLTII